MFKVGRGRDELHTLKTRHRYWHPYRSVSSHGSVGRLRAQASFQYREGGKGGESDSGILTSKAFPARTEDGEVMLTEKNLLRMVAQTVSVGCFFFSMIWGDI